MPPPFFLKNGVPVAGSLIRNPGLANTLETIGREGRHGFYEGDVADALASYVAQRGGFFTAADLQAQRAEWGVPLVGQYHDLTLYQTPAPTQGSRTGCPATAEAWLAILIVALAAVAVYFIVRK